MSGVVQAAAHLPILVVGAGPAGLSCALWLHNLGLRVWLIDSSTRMGGLQNLNTLANDWVLGHIGQTGPQLAAQFARHVAALPVRTSLGVSHFEAWRSGSHWTVRVHSEEDTAQTSCAAVVLATGTRVRGRESLRDVSGVEAVEQHLRYGPAAFEGVADAARGRTLIVGGGDNAVENARMLVEQGGEVLVLARSSFRAQAGLFAVLQGHPRVRCLSPARLLALLPQAHGFRAEFSGPQGVESIQAERLHVLTGYEPNSDFSANFAIDIWQRLQHDAQAYLHVDACGRCGPEWMYAAGDLCNPAFPSVVSAIAQGASVAKIIERDLRNASFGI